MSVVLSLLALIQEIVFFILCLLGMFLFFWVSFVPGILQIAAFGALEKLSVPQITVFAGNPRPCPLQIAALAVLKDEEDGK